MLYNESLKVLEGLGLELEDCFGLAGVGGIPTYPKQINAKYERCVDTVNAKFRMTLFVSLNALFLAICVALGVALAVWRKVKARREQLACLSSMRMSDLQAGAEAEEGREE